MAVAILDAHVGFGGEENVLCNRWCKKYKTNEYNQISKKKYNYVLCGSEHLTIKVLFGFEVMFLDLVACTSTLYHIFCTLFCTFDTIVRVPLTFPNDSRWSY